MKPTWIMIGGVMSLAIPLISAVVRREPLTAPLRWVLGWIVVLIGFNLTGPVLALSGRNSQVLTYVLTPVVTAVAFRALSDWQISRRAALGFRALIPLLIGVWLLLIGVIEDTRTASLVARPFAGLLLLGGAVWTLLTRINREEEPLPCQDWLWVCSGLGWYAFTSLALPPIAWLLADVSQELVGRAYQVKALADVLAFGLVGRGLLCPRSDRVRQRSAPALLFGGKTS